jgi:hypothetical protein
VNEPDTALDQRFSSPDATAAGWDEGLDVVAEGDAVRVSEDALLTRLARAWARKWDGQWQFEVRDGAFESPGGGEGKALVFEVRPAKVLAFAKGRFGQTRHSFP